MKDAGTEFLRDYFAGQAIVGLLANRQQDGSSLNWMPEAAYKIADQMLKARVPPPQEKPRDDQPDGS